MPRQLRHPLQRRPPTAKAAATQATAQRQEATAKEPARRQRYQRQNLTAKANRRQDGGATNNCDGKSNCRSLASLGMPVERGSGRRKKGPSLRSAPAEKRPRNPRATVTATKATAKSAGKMPALQIPPTAKSRRDADGT
jgi:hypothetical protein